MHVPKWTTTSEASRALDQRDRGLGKAGVGRQTGSARDTSRHRRSGVNVGIWICCEACKLGWSHATVWMTPLRDAMSTPRLGNPTPTPGVDRLNAFRKLRCGMQGRSLPSRRPGDVGSFWKKLGYEQGPTLLDIATRWHHRAGRGRANQR